MDYDYTKIEEKMKSLPEDLQTAMASTQTANLIQDIAEKHELDVEETGQLFDLTGYVMLGIIPSKTFVSELKKQLGINSIKANEIASDVNTDVFGSIRSSLQKIQADESTSETTATTNMQMEKDHVLNTIENPTSSTTVNPPINLLSEEYPLVISGQKSEPIQKTASTAIPTPTIPSTPVKPAPSLNMMDRMMSSPVSTKTETVEKKIGTDPYREPLE